MSIRVKYVCFMTRARTPSVSDENLDETEESTAVSPTDVSGERARSPEVLERDHVYGTLSQEAHARGGTE